MVMYISLPEEKQLALLSKDVELSTKWSNMHKNSPDFKQRKKLRVKLLMALVLIMVMIIVVISFINFNLAKELANQRNQEQARIAALEEYVAFQELGNFLQTVNGEIMSFMGNRPMISELTEEEQPQEIVIFSMSDDASFP